MTKRQGEILGNNEQSSTAGIVLTLGLIGVTIFGLKIQNGNFDNPLNNVHFKLSTTTEKTIEVEPVAQLDRTSIASRMVQSVIGLFESDSITLVDSSSVEQPAKTYDMNKIEKEVSRQQKTESEQFAEKAKIALENNDYRTYTWNFLRARGYSEITTAAVMGSVEKESRFSPKASPLVYKQGALFGGGTIFQHIGKRYELLKIMYPNDYHRFDVQLAFGCYELEQGNYQKVLIGMQKTNKLDEAVIDFAENYEVANARFIDIERRIEFAKRFLALYGENSDS